MSATLHMVVAGTPAGDAEHTWDVHGDGELTLTIEYKNYVRLITGELTPPVAYMQGLLKSTGDMPLMLDFLAGSVAPSFSKLRDELAKAIPA